MSSFPYARATALSSEHVGSALAGLAMADASLCLAENMT
jgi:hypothetical protein